MVLLTLVRWIAIYPVDSAWKIRSLSESKWNFSEFKSLAPSVFLDNGERRSFLDQVMPSCLPVPFPLVLPFCLRKRIQNCVWFSEKRTEKAQTILARVASDCRELPSLLTVCLGQSSQIYETTPMQWLACKW